MATQHGHHWLERRDEGEVTVVRFLIPRLQVEEDIHDLFKQIYHLADDVGRRRLVLHLGRVEYVNSATIGKLVMLNKKVEAAKGRLALCHLTPDMRGLLEKMHLQDLFQIYEDEQQALQSFTA
jgi:anti-sigma B factor antagonist